MTTTPPPKFRLVGGPMLPPPPDVSRARLRRTLLRLGVAGLVLAGLVAFHRPLLIGYARLFRVDDPAPSDAIVLLLGGVTSRPARAAELYRQGLAPRILLGQLRLGDSPVADETARTVEILQERGVPREAIEVLPGEVESTRQEAERIAPYARSHALRRITVVTTAFHTARARWVFRKALEGTGVEVRTAASDDPEIHEEDWYREDEGLVAYFSETIRLLYYWVRYWAL